MISLNTNQNHKNIYRTVFQNKVKVNYPKTTKGRNHIVLLTYFLLKSCEKRYCRMFLFKNMFLEFTTLTINFFLERKAK